MKPMGYNSTQFISYHEIKVEDIDLYEDAWGIHNQFSDVKDVLDLVKPVVSRQLTKRLLEAVRGNQ
jgi:hypothetical protein